MAPACPKPLRFAAALLLAGLALTGCAFPSGVAPGSARAEVLASLGPPTASYGLPNGSRLQYSQQPLGRKVYNIDLDPADRVVSVTQTLEANVFDRVPIGSWTADDVLRTFGPAAEISRVSSFNGTIWTYRYEEFNNLRQFHVYFDPQGIVRRSHSTDELTIDSWRPPL